MSHKKMTPREVETLEKDLLRSPHDWEEEAERQVEWEFRNSLPLNSSSEDWFDRVS